MRSTSILRARGREAGFTLIELLMALLLFAVLLSFSTGYITNVIDEARFAESVRRLKILRKGLVGETKLRAGGQRSEFGFNGDIGALPTAAQGFGALSSNPGLPAWNVNSTARIGLGWSGNYLDPVNYGDATGVDAWGTPLVYAPIATPPTVTSLGADRALGGTGLNADLQMQLPASVRRTKVHGIILQGGAQWSGTAQVELNSVNGAGALVTTLVNVAAADKGHFVFTDVPQGVRSATVYVPSKAAATTTIGPSVFTVDRPHYLIPVNFFDLAPITVGPTSLEVPLEMLDYGVSSQILNLFTTFERSRTLLDTNDYDGAVTYSFELNATNSSLVPTVISLVNAGGGSVGTITVPGNTTVPTRLRVAFTPTAGSNDYRLQIPLTLLLNQVTVYSARILVRQLNATKTRIYVPLVGAGSTDFDSTDGAVIDNSTSTTFGQPTPLRYSIWKKDLSQLSVAAGSPYTFAAVLTGALLGTAQAALYNRTANAAVTGAGVTSVGVAPGLQQVSFGNGAGNFADLAEYEVRMRGGGFLASGSLAKAGLYIRLASLGRGEVYYRVARTQSGTASATVDSHRALVNPTYFSNPTVFAEATGFASVAGVNNAQLLDAAANDSGTAGTLVTGASVTLPAAKARVRSPGLTLTPGNRTIGRLLGNGAANSSLTSEMVLVRFNFAAQ